MRIRAIDAGELARFILTGVTATIGNMAAVWLVRSVLPFETALLVGVAVGLVISFVLSKWFAFASRSWERAPGEAARFLLVYAAGFAVYWTVAVLVARAARGHGLAGPLGETAAIVAGAFWMAVTTYFGHRFFTYRTHTRVAVRDAS